MKKKFTIAELYESMGGINYRRCFYPCNIVSDPTGTYVRESTYNIRHLTEENRTFIITNIIKHLEYYSINYVVPYGSAKGNQFGSVDIPNDFVLQQLTKKEYTSTKKEYTKRSFAQLESNIPHGFTIGADPELFVEDDKGEVIPAFDFLQDRDHPENVRSGGGMFWDGFQAEMTPNQSTCHDDMTSALRRIMVALDQKAKKYNPNARLSLKTVVDIPLDVLQEAKDDHVAFGCGASINAYGMSGIVGDGRSIPFRTTGGHIHFGIGTLDEETANRIAKALDAIIGVACVSLFEGIDDPRRREMYGLAGEYRLPKYGLEYRTLSSAWLCHPTIAYLVLDLARKAVVIGERDLLKMYKGSEKNIVRIINECDVQGARKLLKNNKDLYCKIFNTIYFDPAKSKTAFDIFYRGVNKTVENPDDISGNWNLDAPNEGYSVRRFSSNYTKVRNGGKLTKRG